MTMDDREPSANNNPVPVIFFVALICLFYGGTLYLDGNAGGFHPQVYAPYASIDDVQRAMVSDTLTPYDRGKRIYDQLCSVCHQPHGKGQTGLFPPLAGSDWVLEDSPERIARIVLNGVKGEITVNGVKYNNAMVPWKDYINSDEDLAGILTYIRQSWGNTASEIVPEQVSAIREEASARNSEWTEAELLQIPLGE